MTQIPTPKPRNLKLEFPREMPRHWHSGDAVATHMANALNLLFPAGERYFIRSVRAVLDRVEDPELCRQVGAFIAQEVQHGREHERFFEVLEGQGFELGSFLKFYERVAYGWIERALSRKMNLAVTAAVEHYTAAFADDALRNWLPLGGAHPAMEDLFRWHAMEEIEHKAVAFDVLRSVAPGYLRRVAGMLVATMTLGGFWILGIGMFLRKDPDASVGLVLRQVRKGPAARALRRRTMSKAFVQYLRPGFHPSKVLNHDLAAEALQVLARKYPQVA